MRMIKPKRCFVYVLAILALVLGAAVAQESTVTANPGVIYVDVGATGLNDGTSWANAFNYLQDGLSAAGAGDEVWVAEGVYRPDEDTANPGGTGNRTATFQLIDGVALYGGFAGVETNLNERDWQTNLTILSGDLDGDDGPGPFENNGENGYHVVYASWYTTATLDGFVVSGGNADNPSPDSSGAGLHSEGSSLTLTGCTFSGNYAANGGGMYNYASSPTLTDCTFDDNYASQDGAAMFNSGSSPTLAECTFGSNGAGGDGGGICNYNSSPDLVNCTFSDNDAQYGGGMCNVSSSPTLTKCTFSGNEANYGGGMCNYSSSDAIVVGCSFTGNEAERGGAIHNVFYSSATLINCTFSGNQAFSDGGGVYTGTEDAGLTVTNCVLWENSDNGGTDESAQIHAGTDAPSPMVNYSCVQGWTTALGGMGNTGDDPLLVDADGEDNIAGTLDDDLHLSAGSPCTDTGDNGAVPAFVTTDLDGNPRIVDGDGNGTAIVDMGAYEFQFQLQPGTEVDIRADVTVVQAGNDVTLTITETNTGNVDLTDPYVELTGYGSTGEVVFGPGTYDETHISWASDLNNNAALEPGETWTWTVVVTMSETTAFTATGHGTAPDGTDITYPAYPNERDDVTVTVAEADEPDTLVAISASAEVVQAGDDVNLTITETNTGNVELTDPYVELAGYDSTGAVVFGPGTYDETHTSWASDLNNNAALEQGETWTWTVVVTMSETTALTATGHGTAPDGTDITHPAYPNERDEVTVSVEEADEPDSLVDIRASAEVVQAGDDVTLTITETNTGNVDLTDPYVELTGYDSTGEAVFGPGNYDEADASWASDLNNNAALEQGETWTWTVVVTMGETTAFTATGHGTAPDGTDITYPTYPNERDEVTVTVAEADEPDTLADIQADAMVVQAGDDVTLTITETNTGSVDVTDTYVELAGYDTTGAVVFGPYTYDETHTSWAGDLNDNVVLEEGETWTWTVVVTMSETTAFTATGHGTAPDGTDITYPAYPNERDQVTVTVAEADEPDTLVDISTSAEVVQAGDDVTVTITETNTGNVDLTDPYVGLTGYGSSGEVVFGPNTYDETHTSWASDLNNNTALEQGETWTWTVVVTMSETTAFTATGHGTAPDGTDITYPAYPNERDDVTVAVAEADEPDTLVGIQADAMVVQAGDDVTLTITETNTGSVDLIDPYMELAGYDTTGAAVFGPYAYNETHTSWASDSNNNAALEQGETWTWTVVVTVRETTTFTATGHGTHPDTGEDVAYPPYESQVDEVIITVGETDEPDNSTPDGGNEDSGMPNPGEPAGTHTAGTSDSTGSWLWIPLVAAAAAIAAIVLPVVIMGPRRRSQD